MSLDGRASSTAIDQEQLDQRLTKLIVDHSNYRTHIIRYIRRALALCTWHIDLDYPSYFHQLEKTDKLVNLVLFIREHAMQSFQTVDRTGTLLLSQVDILLARAGSIPPTAGSPLAGGMSPGKAVQLGSKSTANSQHDQDIHRGHLQGGSEHPAANSNIRAANVFSNNRMLCLAGEVKEAIRFWREQCLCASWMEPKVYEMGRIGELRDLALTGDGSTTIEEKARGLRIWCEQARLVTGQMEPFLDQWLAKLSSVDRSKDEQAHGYGAGHPMPVGAIGPLQVTTGMGTFAVQSVDSPATYPTQTQP
ncbi:MAG: hypothetical protein J3Q66DRAFT_349485 [Benniella sp.]|nr:MAG: hypothetical protein J3Q66DRAFT_349485 [Benniella sp.]